MSPRNQEPGGLGINGVIPGDGACVVAGCASPCSPNSLMCPRHWREVPPDLKGDLGFATRRWRRGRANLVELRDAQWACVESIAP